MSAPVLLAAPAPKASICPRRRRVVSVPNKNAKDRGGINIDQRIIDGAKGIVTLGPRVPGRQAVEHVSRSSRPRRVQGEPSSGLPAGTLMNSSGLGWGDLGWGSQRHGFFVPEAALGHHLGYATGCGVEIPKGRSLRAPLTPERRR